MPGIHFCFSNREPLKRDAWDRAVDACLHRANYRREELYRDERAFLDITRYPEYPLTIIDDDARYIVLEGRIYGQPQSAIRSDLIELAVYLNSESQPSNAWLTDWLLAHDGDYVLIIHDRASHRWWFLNDALGRLPVYLYQQDSHTVLSREFRLMADSSLSPRPDRLGLAQYMLFGFGVGQRTLLDWVKRLPPATLLRWGGPDRALHRTSVHEFNLGEKQPARSAAHAAADLVELFVQACRDRAGPADKTVLSLSGGLDSRAVAAGLVRAGCGFQALTFHPASAPANREIESAREVARRLDTPWDSIALNSYTGDDVQSYLRFKHGLLNCSGTADLQYMNEVESRFGAGITHFSGDGGDKLIPEIRTARRFASDAALARYIIARNQLMPLDDVTRLVRVSGAELIADLESVLSSYPETDGADKYVRFVIYERGMRWLYEGEDHNRCFFWSCTPFYSLPFFRMAMNCPDRLKRGHRLYREFLSKLSPAVASVVDAGRGRSPISSRYRWDIAAVRLLGRYPGLLRTVKRALRPAAAYPESAAIYECLARQVDRGNSIGDYFYCDAIQSIASRRMAADTTTADNLLTLTALIENLSGTESSLAYFQDRVF